MCPACFAAAAWIAAGAGSAGGLTAFVVTRRRERKHPEAEQARTTVDNSAHPQKVSRPGSDAQLSISSM
jgi:hypothetical protein